MWCQVYWRSCRVTQGQPITGFALFERGLAAGVVVSGVLEVMQGSRKVKVPGVVEVMPGSPGGPITGMCIIRTLVYWDG